MYIEVKDEGIDIRDVYILFIVKLGMFIKFREGLKKVLREEDVKLLNMDAKVGGSNGLFFVM